MYLVLSFSAFLSKFLTAQTDRRTAESTLCLTSCSMLWRVVFFILLCAVLLSLQTRTLWSGHRLAWWRTWLVYNLQGLCLLGTSRSLPYLSQRLLLPCGCRPATVRHRSALTDCSKQILLTLLNVFHSLNTGKWRQCHEERPQYAQGLTELQSKLFPSRHGWYS